MESRFSQDKTTALYAHVKKKMEYDRSNGFHGSDAIFCNYKPFLKERFAIEQTDAQTATYSTGHAFQEWIHPVSQADSRVYTLDGVALTPDITNTYFITTFINLAEMKSTKASIGWFVERDSLNINHHYSRQMMQYCKVLDTRESDLILLFLMGDYYTHPQFIKGSGERRNHYVYKNNSRPSSSFQVWEYKFTEHEIDTWWTEVLRRRDIFNRAVASGGLPEEHIMAFENECKNCECSPVCPHYESKLLNNGNGRG